MTQAANPFEPPKSEWTPEPERPAPGVLVPASLGARLAASLIDTLILISLIVPLQVLFGVYDDFPKVEPLGFLASAVWSAVGFTIWLALNGYLLAKRGQSVGKLALGICIVNVGDGKPASLKKIVLLRYLPVQLVATIPFAGTIAILVDTLFIFRKDRRCIHDHIAGTRVVAVDPFRR